MRPATPTLRNLGLVAALLLLAAAAHPLRAQSAITRDDIVKQLTGLDAAPDLDVAALREQVLKRSQSRSKNEPPPQKRPPIAPDLAKLPSFNVNIQFDTDTPIVLPGSYQTVGFIADALVQSTMLPYAFLIIGHIEANGKRESNALLSQRSADAIRDVLGNTFKISSKRLQSVRASARRQLLDAAHPTAASTASRSSASKLPDHERRSSTGDQASPASAKASRRR